ncbi:MAG: hypothetical protein WDZ82_01035 [Candidatus Paceibacterota bacterium]
MQDRSEKNKSRQGKTETEPDREEFPDQRLFEPDPELEGRPPGFWEQVWPFIRFVGAGLAVGGLLYVSGAYQAFLLRETPQSVRQEPIPSKVESELVTVPVHVFLVTTNTSNFGTQRDIENAERLVENAGNIWAQANIRFSLSGVQRLEVSPFDIDQFHRDPQAFVSSVFQYNDRQINIFLTGTLSGLNGVAFGGTEGLAVADRVSHFDFRTLAHEIGHLFGLGHTQRSKWLMSQGAYGNELSLEEIQIARTHAKRLVD